MLSKEEEEQEEEEQQQNNKNENENKNNNKNKNKKEWIRGVNIGGWLMAERFITPYLFAINTCHLNGSLCWYPGQIGSPPSEYHDSSSSKSKSKSNVTTTTNDDNDDDNDDDLFCNMSATQCQPVLSIKAKPPTDYHLIHHGINDDNNNNNIGNSKTGAGINSNGMDYPVDEYTLGQVLRTSSSDGINTATKYMDRHWDTFLTYNDLKILKQNGVTHLRIPMGYWIRSGSRKEDNDDNDNDDNDNEPYIPGGWKYFVRACKWARQLGLVVWADLHGAPGSENGFDNSGHYLGKSSCNGWSSSSKNVQRTLDIITDIALAVKKDNINDVVTGFGILNEPFSDCSMTVLKQYYNDALINIRSILGDNTSIFIGDTFRSDRFNDGSYWIDNEEHHNTYLDSHPYHVFFEQGRSFTPKQHIAYVCHHDTSSVKDCCYEDAPDTKTIPSHGISRLTGEWSGSFDSLPTALTPNLMKGISLNGQVPMLNRTLSKKRSKFLRNFVQAQMIAYEAADSITKDSPNGIASGWLFWNFKMEGGAFIEWDFLRGLKEGWMPPIPEPTISSESLYGSCLDIYNRTDDDYSIVDEYPNPRTLDWNQWQGWDANDDFVMSDPNAIRPDVYRHNIPLRKWYDIRRITTDQRWFIPLLIGMVILFILNKFGLRSYIVNKKKRENSGYTELKVYV